MTTVSNIYFTASGYTAKMAEAVKGGAASRDGVKQNSLSSATRTSSKGAIQKRRGDGSLNASDAIIFGGPTYMGGPAAQFKAFADATVKPWCGQEWRDKWGAGFTVRGALSGDKEDLLTAESSAIALPHSR
jgi:NAD(P)H dehydrogenase (quinone)